MKHGKRFLMPNFKTLSTILISGVAIVAFQNCAGGYKGSGGSAADSGTTSSQLAQSYNDGLALHAKAAAYLTRRDTASSGSSSSSSSSTSGSNASAPATGSSSAFPISASMIQGLISDITNVINDMNTSDPTQVSAAEQTDIQTLISDLTNDVQSLAASMPSLSNLGAGSSAGMGASAGNSAGAGVGAPAGNSSAGSGASATATGSSTPITYSWNGSADGQQVPSSMSGNTGGSASGGSGSSAAMPSASTLLQNLQSHF